VALANLQKRLLRNDVMRTYLIRSARLWWRESRHTLKLGLPIMAGMVSQMLMGLADTVMVGRVGVVPLAASAFVNAISNLPLVFGMGLLTSMAVLTSQAFGARRADEAGELLRHGLIVSTGMGFAAALAVICVYPFLHRLGQPPEVVEEARIYLFLFAASLVPALIAHGCKQFSEALKHPWAASVVLFGGVLLNVFLNWIFIFGHWGVPAMGLTGAGIATLIARFIMMLVLLAYVLRAPALRRFQPLKWKAALSSERFGRLLHLGWPVAVQHLLEVSAFAFAAIMMGWISADAIAAHQIAINCASITFMFALGTGMAVSIRVGHAHGARQFARMRRIGFGGLGLAVGIMGAFAVVLMLAGRPIAGLFIESQTVIAIAAQMLVVAAVFQVADGIQVVSISALRGLNDVRVPAVIAALAYWVVALPVGGLIAFNTKWSAVGIWFGLASGLGVAACLLAWRFHLKTKKIVTM
jgi:MATE family multidrug resistance protein